MFPSTVPAMVNFTDEIQHDLRQFLPNLIIITYYDIKGYTLLLKNIVNTSKSVVSKVKDANPIWLIIVTGVVVGGLNYIFTGLLPGAYSQQQELIYATREQSDSIERMTKQMEEMVKFRQELIVVNERMTNMLSHDQRTEAKLDQFEAEMREIRERTQHLEWQMRQPSQGQSEYHGLRPHATPPEPTRPAKQLVE